MKVPTSRNNLQPLACLSIDVIRGEGNWLTDDLTFPLLSIELIIDTVVMLNCGEEKLNYSDHRVFLASSPDFEFEQEPVKD